MKKLFVLLIAISMLFISTVAQAITVTVTEAESFKGMYVGVTFNRNLPIDSDGLIGVVYDIVTVDDIECILLFQVKTEKIFRLPLSYIEKVYVLGDTLL